MSSKISWSGIPDPIKGGGRNELSTRICFFLLPELQTACDPLPHTLSLVQVSPSISRLHWLSILSEPLEKQLIELLYSGDSVLRRFIACCLNVQNVKLSMLPQCPVLLTITANSPPGGENGCYDSHFTRWEN